MIKKFIFKTNEWYENLPKIKGGVFYFLLIFIPYTLSFIMIDHPYSSIYGLSWVFMVAMWRASYIWIKDWENIKNNKNDI